MMRLGNHQRWSLGRSSGVIMDTSINFRRNAEFYEDQEMLNFMKTNGLKLQGWAMATLHTLHVELVLPARADVM